MSSFRFPFALPVLLCALVACTATPPSEAQAPEPDAASDRPTAAPPPGASGKLSPEMVGKVSPVPAFRGQGGRGAKRWTISIHSDGEMRHRVELIWAQTHERLQGSVFYRGAPTPSTHGAPIALDGTVETAKGSRTVRVEILTEACTDVAGVVHPQRVKIALQGRATMNGCGELAVY